MMSPSSFAVFALKFLQKSMMFTPWGPSAVPTGGAGVALPAAIWSFTIACTFFAGTPALQTTKLTKARKTRKKLLFVFVCFVFSGFSWLDLLHLQKVQLHRGRAAEDRHHHLQRVLVEVHLVDHAVEAGERPFVDPDLLAFFEHVLRLRLLRRGFHLRQDLLDFILAERRRLGAGADKAGHLGRVLDD